MFNVGGPEIVVILIVALLILGPDQLPKAMRTFGNVMGEIRKVSGGFQAEMKKAMDTIDISGTEKADQPEKPQSAGGPTARPATAETMEQADVTEVVARNPAGPGTDAAVDPSAGPSGDVDPVPERPAVDPADRAAG